MNTAIMVVAVVTLVLFSAAVLFGMLYVVGQSKDKALEDREQEEYLRNLKIKQ